MKVIVLIKDIPSGPALQARLAGPRLETAAMPNSRTAKWRWVRLSETLGVVFVDPNGSPWPSSYLLAFLRAAIENQEIRAWGSGEELCLWIHRGDVKDWDDGPSDGKEKFGRPSPDSGSLEFTRVLVMSRINFNGHRLDEAWASIEAGMDVDHAFEIISSAIADSGSRHVAGAAEALYSIRHELFRELGTIEIDRKLGSDKAAMRIRGAIASFQQPESLLARRLDSYRQSARGDVALRRVVDGLDELLAEGRAIAARATQALGEGPLDTDEVLDGTKDLADWLLRFREECAKLDIPGGRAADS